MEPAVGTIDWDDLKILLLPLKTPDSVAQSTTPRHFLRGGAQEIPMA
jgi:hypothetical protein